MSKGNTVVMSKNLKILKLYMNYLNIKGIYMFKYLWNSIICYSSNNIFNMLEKPPLALAPTNIPDIAKA